MWSNVLMGLLESIGYVWPVKEIVKLVKIPRNCVPYAKITHTCFK